MYVLIVLLTNAATMAQQIQPTWTRPRPNTNRRLVRLSKNLSNAPPVSSVRRHIVGHALDMQGKSFHPTAFTDCTVARDMPMVGDPLAPASLHSGDACRDLTISSPKGGPNFGPPFYTSPAAA